MAAKIVAIVEDENARIGPGGAAVEPGGCEPADAAADHDEIVALLDRRVVGVKVHAGARQRMGYLEGARMLAAQTGECRRMARRGRRRLRARRQPGRNRQGHAVEKVATGYSEHGEA